MAHTKTIKELRDTWESNREWFKVHELGRLQDFVKDIFESEELFSLTYGDFKRDNKKRKCEFTREESAKGAGGERCESASSGRADFTVFIDGEEIVIPVEVEKFGHIRDGEAQLLRYQTEWQKKYGILTDGNEWRLYFDRCYETFYLEKDILNKKSDFWRRWKQYITPKNYYDQAFNITGQLNLLGTERLNPCTAENRPYFFNDITNLLSVFRTKITDNFPHLRKQGERRAVETTYSYVIQFILYKVLIDNNYEKLKNDYEVFRDRVRSSLLDKTYDSIIKDIGEIAEYIYKNIYEPFRKKQDTINQLLMKQVKKSTTLSEIAPWLDIIMFTDRYNFADIRNEIFGFVYENYLKELYQDKNKGQYFTDPAIVDFMLNELGYTKEALSETDGENISIIDPSCGAGTFLYSATLRIKETFDENTKTSSQKIERLISDNVYGLDIEEFPLFLAEMNILMQLLPVVVNSKYNNVITEKLKLFITKDSIAEFLDSAISAKPDEDSLQINMFDGFDTGNTPPYMRDESDMMDLFQSLEGGLDHRKRFDYVIGNPPYVGYNECTNMKFAKKIKEKNGTFTMGNVYGVNLNTVPGRRKPYSPKPNLYAFFIALGLGLLKEGGRICYIIPQTILTAGDLDVLRYHLSKYTTIEKIITFEGKMFIGRGLTQKKPVPTSSLIFICKKAPSKKTHKTIIVNYNTYNEKQAGNLGSYLNSKRKTRKDILQTELLKNVENWNFIKLGILEQKCINLYKSDNTLSIEEYRKYALADYDEICLDGGLKLNDNDITVNPAKNSFRVFNPKINNYAFYVTTPTNLFYPQKASIEFIPGGQGMKAFLYKYKIIWKTRFVEKFQISMEENLILNNNQSLIISSDNRDVILFLLALLNSSISMFILEKMLKLPNEATYMVPITAIKSYIRVPKITVKNKPVKTEIIKQAEALLNLEKPVLKDMVNFPQTTIQRFDSINVVENTLVLSYENKPYTAKIKNNKTALVENLVKSEYTTVGNFPPKKDIILDELRFLPAIDFEEQKKIKHYIDDLVFALYFDVPVNNLGIENAAAIHRAVAKHDFFPIIDTLNR